MQKKRQKKNEGFTLIEIIAVLVIIAILAAAAVPKFLSLINDSKLKALEGAAAAGQSQCSLAFGKLCLQNGTAPDAGAVATAVQAAPPASAEFGWTFTAVGTSNVTIVAKFLSSATPTVTKTWVVP